MRKYSCQDVEKFAKSRKFQIRTFTSGLQFIKTYLLLMFANVSKFLKLEKLKQGATMTSTPLRSGVKIHITNYEEDSDDNESSFRTSLSNSRVSKISQADSDNNNESNVTPTLNNSVPRITPEIKIANSTPLNHYNHQDGLSNRKFRRDLTKLR